VTWRSPGGDGGASTDHVRAAGVGSTLPDASIARTANVCWPSESGPPYGFGDAQDAQADPSSEHWNVERFWLAAKANCADGDCVLPLGPVVMVVSGGVRSVNFAHRARLVNHIWNRQLPDAR
jgi:hypothetical protein